MYFVQLHIAPKTPKPLVSILNINVCLKKAN